VYNATLAILLWAGNTNLPSPDSERTPLPFSNERNHLRRAGDVGASGAVGYVVRSSDRRLGLVIGPIHR
jgi:hypothetical protein